MDLTDLFVVFALVSAVYGVLVLLTRDHRFLHRAVNPFRGAWLIAGFSAFWGGVALLRWETNTWNPRAWGEVLTLLVRPESISTNGKVASVAIIAGLLFIGLVAWCTFTMPRAPSTFHRPADRKRAFQYYVSGLRGGLDYAALVWADGTIIEEAHDQRKIKRMAEHLPRVTPDAEGQRHVRSAEEQVQFWREAAQKIHKAMTTLDEVIAPAHQGTNRRLLFDCEFGGMLFIYLRMPEARDPDGEYLYLFAATLNQGSMNDRVADAHFALLLEALRTIEQGIKMA